MSAANPTTWQSTKIKFASKVMAGGTPQSSVPDYWDGPIPWLTPVDLGKKGSCAIEGSSRTLTHAGVAAAGLYILLPGTIVISTRAPIGSVGLLACEATTNQGCKAIFPDKRKLDSKFAYYFALDAADELKSLGLGTTFIELSTYSLKNLKLELPSPPEQRRIAAYLDEQTAKIDRLMELRRRQMALLKEQRAALIQQAVTRGLNPNAPMKNSGIPWLGDIPEHWDLKRLKYVCKITTGSKDTVDADQDGVYPFFVRSQIIEKIGSYSFDGEAVLTAGDGAGVGKVFHHYVGKFDFHQRVYMLFNFKEILGEFVFHYLKENFYKVALEGGAKSTVDSLRMPVFLNFMMTIPPIDEQKVILDSIKVRCSQNGQLLEAYARQLTLLAEYRVSLIHECVTGQRPVPEPSSSQEANAHAL